MRRKVAFLIVVIVSLSFSGCALFISDTYESTKYQAVHEAALNGDRQKMDELLAARPRLLNVPDYDKNTLLHLAVLRNQFAEVKDLLARGAKVNAMNSARMTPLHVAAKLGESEITKLLLSYHPKLSVRDARGWTALKWAEKSHHESVAKLLREAGARE